MYFKSGEHFLIMALNKTLTITDPHVAQLRYNWGEKCPENCPGEMWGIGNVSGKCPRECPEEECPDTVPEWCKRKMVTLLYKDVY